MCSLQGTSPCSRNTQHRRNRLSTGRNIPQARTDMRQYLSNLFNQNSRPHRPTLTVSLLAMAVLACLTAVLLASGETTSFAAQISPILPLNGVDSGGPSIALAPWPMVNVMASGQAALMRLALLLFAVIVSAGVIMWRRP